MTNPPTPKEVTQAAVIQADRDAAAAYMTGSAHEADLAAYRGGQYDEGVTVQAFARHRIAATERAAAYVEAQAKQAQDTYDLISVQSTLPVLPPMFSCDGLRTIATAIREDSRHD